MKIVFTKTFEKSILKIDKNMQVRIIKKIDDLGKNDSNLDIKKLNPKERAIFRLRVGKYRILFKYIDTYNILLLNVDNRDSIYLI